VRDVLTALIWKDKQDIMLTKKKVLYLPALLIFCAKYGRAHEFAIVEDNIQQMGYINKEDRKANSCSFS
jgi:hypothetical protein